MTRSEIIDGCELLSDCIFIGFIDILFVEVVRPSAVVNCFQIVSLLGSSTSAISENDPGTADKAPKAISEDAENPLDAINEIAKEYLGKEL